MSEFKLNDFQKKTVDHIIDYFEGHNVYLLADETGIGKTVIASEVARRTTSESGKSQSVLYIASSLDLAKENIQKLKFEGSEVIEGRLSMLWKELGNREIEGTKLFALTPAVSLNMTSKGTETEKRACENEWLRQLEDQEIKNQDLSEKMLKLNHLIRSIQSSTDDRYFKLLERNKEKSTRYLKKLRNVNVGKYKEIQYTYNKEEDLILIAQEVVAICLFENVLDYMIYEYNTKAKLDPILQLPSVKDAVERLFPETSTSIGRKYFEILWEGSDKKVDDHWGENVRQLVEQIAEAIGGKWDDIFKEIKETEEIYPRLEVALREIYCNDYYKLIRCYMAHYSLTEYIKPDLVIIDEIQNYPQIFSETEGTDEETAVIQSILNEVLGKKGEDKNKKDVKVLMLSATPYAYKNAIEIEDKDYEIDELESFTKHLVGMEEILSYMAKKNRIPDVDIIRSWKSVQESLNTLTKSSKNEIDMEAFNKAKEEVENLSSEMLKLGISRSERPKKTYKPDKGKYTISEVDISEFANYFVKGKSPCGTRMAMSLPREITAERIKAKGYKVFDDSVEKVEFSDGKKVESSRISAMMEDLFQGNMCYFLFIPPNKPSHELGGIYQNSQRKYGKTLLFSAYNAVPQCLQETVEQYLYEKLVEKSGWDPKTYEENYNKLNILSVDDYLEKSTTKKENDEDTIRGLKDTDEKVKKHLYTIFTSTHAKRVILSLYKEEAVKDYCACMDSYSIDGNLSAVMQEFAYMCSIQKNSPKVEESMGDAQVSEAQKFSVAYCSSSVEHFEEKIRAFNNPFYPFAFFITSMAEEGHDFHWYSDRIVHWNAPVSPISLIQREGRIDRADCMSIRKAISEAMKEHYEFQEMSWETLISEFVKKNVNSIENELYKNMFPKFITGEKENIIHRMCYYYPLSSEYFRWEILMKNLEYYRSMFGACDNTQLEEIGKVLDDEETWTLLKQLELDIHIK